MRPSSRLLALSLLVALPMGVGCSEPPAEPTEEPAAPSPVTLRVDGEEVARVSLPDGAEARPLASLLSGPAANADAWTHLQARSAGGQQFGVRHPTRRYPDTEVRIFRDEGALSVGIFRKARPDLAPEVAEELGVPILALRDVESVEVFLDEPTPAAPPDALAPILIAVDGAEPVAFTSEELGAIERATDPRGRAQGWALRDLIRAKVGEAEVTAIELVLRDGTREGVDPAALADARRLLLIKHNREGELRYQEYLVGGPEGVGPQRAQHVIRELARVEVTTGAAAD